MVSFNVILLKLTLCYLVIVELTTTIIISFFFYGVMDPLVACLKPLKKKQQKNIDAAGAIGPRDSAEPVKEATGRSLAAGVAT